MSLLPADEVIGGDRFREGDDGESREDHSDAIGLLILAAAVALTTFALDARAGDSRDFVDAASTELLRDAGRAYSIGALEYGPVLGTETARAVASLVDSQLPYLEAFAADLAANNALTEAAIAARASMYAGILWPSYQQGRVAGATEAAALVNPSAELWFKWIDSGDERECGDCAAAAESEGWKASEIPFFPGDGHTSCLCITTPTSRVLTDRGWIPIAAVVVGDLVLTHLGRWRPVLAAPVARSTPTHELVEINAPSGAVVGCTSDHRWLTGKGWATARAIVDNELPVYALSDAETLCSLRANNEIRPKGADMQGMCEHLQLRQGEGLPSGGMPFLRNEPKGQDSVGEQRKSRTDIRGITRSGQGASQSLRRSRRGELQYGEGGRRTGVRAVLARYRAPCLCVSIPMAVESCEREDPERDAHPPFEPRLHRRSAGEFDHADCGGSPPLSLQSAGADSFHARRSGRATQSEGGVRVPDVWAGILQAAFRREATQALLGGLLPEGAALYDLTVAEDHSFIVEGLVAHNSNCRCELEISARPRGE